MANSNHYKLLIEGQLDPKKVEAQIKSLSEKSVLLLRAKFDQTDMSKFEKALEEIRKKASSLGKISLFGDTAGGINKAVVEYSDKVGNVVKEFIAINDEVGITQVYTENLVKNESAITRLKEQQNKLSAKQADEMGRINQKAEEFLAKAKNMQQTPAVKTAIAKAEEIRVSVNQGDLNNVRKLNDEFKIMQAGLQGAKAGLRSWGESLGNAIKQTVSYSLSIGLVYGALNQLKQGLQYIVDLNKELVNIQVLQVEGAQSSEEIANLALQYNGLAKELGATTIEITKGSVEWLRQGKSISETQELLRSTLMLSKLGNLDTAQSTEYLTSILNGFRLEATEATRVVDKLVQLDNMAATSAGIIKFA